MKNIANPLITLVIGLNGLALSAQELREQSCVDARNLVEGVDWIDGFKSDAGGYDMAFSRHGKGFDKTSDFAKGFDKMHDDF